MHNNALRGDKFGVIVNNVLEFSAQVFTRQRVGSGHQPTWAVFDSQVNVMNGGDEENLTNAALHIRVTGMSSCDRRASIGIITEHPHRPASPCSGPEFDGHN